MMNTIFWRFAAVAALAMPYLTNFANLHAQSVEDWTTSVDADNKRTLTMELRLHGQPEAQPALRYRLIPDDFELQEGNAATYYLRAMGFLEQNNARDRLSEVWTESRSQAEAEGKGMLDFPPFVWLSTPPYELPIDDVKEYLALTGFQPRDMAAARHLRTFTLDRNIRDAESAFGFLLPEIQSMRELARNQSLRCRVAIAEGRFDEAFDILGQQFALAHHLSHEPFMVSTLVAAAIEGIAMTDALYAVQMPDAKNLYWAFATLPKPLIQQQLALSTERQLLYLEFKELAEVTDQPRTIGYWQDFILRAQPNLKRMMGYLELWSPEDDELSHAAIVSFIGAAYPGAKRYLLEEIRIAPATVEAYPITQTVLLAIKYFYERTRDEGFKWFAVDFPAALANPQYQSQMARTQDGIARVGWAALPTGMVVPTTQSYAAAIQRVQMHIAILQTIEAIRMYGAANAGQLPASLNDLPLPAPLDPMTGKAFEYRLEGAQATLSAKTQAVTYQLRLQFADVK